MNALDILYPYQKEAVTTTFYNYKGIVCLPTGTGKTFCQAAILANDILMNPGQFRIYVVNAPRILLTYQLLKEVYSFLVSNGIEARYSFVHSGGKTDEKELEEMRISANAEGHDIPFSEIGSGTSIQGIKDMMDKAKAQELPLIIFSTYNSADKIEIARAQFTKQSISIILNDEAHYLVQEQFHDILHVMSSSRCYFFTATTIHTPSDSGRGMNNSELYGNLLYKMIPREAIDLGKMVRPRMHIVKTDGVYSTQDYEKSLSKIIYESFYQHAAVINDKLAPKILISVKGTGDMKKFLSSTQCRTLKEEGVEIYAVASSEEIGNYANGNQVSRQNFLKILKEAGDDVKRKIIVLHYDILAEGIDVSGFTGIMPLRTLSKSKFLQTFGRAARLDKEDRKSIESGIIKPYEVEKLNKPYAYIIVPNVIQTNIDDKCNLTQIITELRDYGFSPSEHIISSSRVNGIPEIEELSSLNDIKIRIPNIGELIENLEAEIESEENAKLSKLDFLKKNLEL
jgi:superfamily II DNA or RNA helicase